MSEPADFDVFSTSSGLKQITNPVRQKILGELSKAELSLTDIANLTGKAQSTLSVHLDKMLKEGLVGSRDDPTDNRRKIFFLLSHPVGKSKMPNDKLREEMRQTVLSSIGDPGTFYKGLLRAMIIGMESVGLGIDSTMRMIGAEIGKALAKKISSDDTEGVISEVQEFYEIHNMGEVCVYTFLPLTIIIRDDYETTMEAGEALCKFNEGLFRSILQEKTGKDLRITESECFGTANNYCKFVIEPIYK